MSKIMQKNFETKILQQSYTIKSLNERLRKERGDPKFSNCSRLNEFVKREGFSMSMCGTQLGNQLGVLALGMMIENQFGVKLIINKSQRSKLGAVFPIDDICKSDGSTFCITNPEGCRFDTDNMEIVAHEKEELWTHGLAIYGSTPDDVRGKGVLLPQYPSFISWIYEGYIARFRNSIKFRDDIWAEANFVMTKLRQHYDCVPYSNCTAVMLHLRMAGYSKHLAKYNWGIDVIRKTNYIQKALRHIRNNYDNPVFFFLGNTDQEVSEFLRARSEKFRKFRCVAVAEIRKQTVPDNLGTGVDLALISQADVVVLSYGTYGDFGALLTRDKQEILYPKDHLGNMETGLLGGLPRFTAIPWKPLKDENS
ncbi:uncharacterized protein LOC134844498 [Symsagittifera roscoffensis]|uniref:uncharacterized protein LOC134844498 n=1 Tax=Symsagittifera roscoffensis TaxID=84072 RepID=UPI00307C4D0E